MFAFALKTLVFDRAKLLIALLGVTFSLVLVHVQGGLFLGMIRKASVLIDNCEADVWVGHRGVQNPDITAEIPEAWLSRIRGLPGVLRAEPYIVAGSFMKFGNGRTEQVVVLGSDRAIMLGGVPAISQGRREDLRQPDSIAIDVFDAPRLGSAEVGDVVQLNGKRAKVVATTNGTLGFLTTPYVFTTSESARDYTGMREGYCSFYLVKADEGTDVPKLCERIRRRVPQLDAYTAKEFRQKSRIYWAIRTGIGLSFGGSTLLGLTVGLVMVAQSLYAFVLDHLGDYATLKAIGAEDKQIHRVLVMQGMAIAIIGITVGTGTSLSIQRLFSTPFTPIEIPGWLLLTGISLVTIICFLSSLLPLGRIYRIDPITVLQD